MPVDSYCFMFLVCIFIRLHSVFGEPNGKHKLVCANILVIFLIGEISYSNVTNDPAVAYVCSQVIYFIFCVNFFVFNCF